MNHDSGKHRLPAGGRHGTILLQPTRRLQALLVGVILPTAAGTEEIREPVNPLEELGELTTTLDIDVAGRLIVKLREIGNRYLVGSGKAEEIVELARNCQADVIIFDDPLTPSQQRNWETLAKLPVIDRQEVILDIFARRARTREAVLQVGLARAQYQLPRLKRLWVHLSRQRGMRGGFGMRGEGEQQIEMDARAVKNQIVKLQREIREVRTRRQVQRHLRRKRAVPLAAIVGYTNAGKSSLLNQLTAAGVFVEDKLFATLDPTVRRLRLPNNLELLLTDTVGFIRKLPHLLIDAFMATLEEIAGADFLIEVIDVANPEIESHHQTTVAVLTELGAERLPLVTVFNKTDLLRDGLALPRIRRKYPDAVFLSARTGDGFDDLLSRLTRQVEHILRPVELLIPHNRYDLLHLLHQTSHIQEQEFTDSGIVIKAAVPLTLMDTLINFEKRRDPA